MSITKSRFSQRRIAGGNHLVGQNDEREPGDLSEADLAEIDAAYHIDLRSGALERRREHRAIEQQVNDFRMAGLL